MGKYDREIYTNPLSGNRFEIRTTNLDDIRCHVYTLDGVEIPPDSDGLEWRRWILNMSRTYTGKCMQRGHRIGSFFIEGGRITQGEGL